MKIEIIRYGNNVIILDGSGKVIADLEWDKFYDGMPYNVQKAIEKALKKGV